MTEEDVRYFIMRKRTEGVSEKTIRDKVHYIRQTLEDMN